MAPAPRRPLLVTTLSTLLAAATLVAAPGVPGAAQAAPRAAGSDLTVVQANVLSPQNDKRFRTDIRRVMRQEPDLITYNEVAFRSDEALAPEGYTLYRSNRDRFTRATPVAWRTDRFTALAQGTTMISDWRGRPPGRVVEIGRRQANWVTLEDRSGRVLSLVSVHLAPRNTGMPDLNRRSVRRLTALVGRLAEDGPVLVGGDFNVPVGGPRYPHDLLDRAQLRSTYQLLGTKFGTSDHGNGQAAIDYLFVRAHQRLRADVHYPVELMSDHDAVVAGLSWTTGRPDGPAAPRVVTNDPSGSAAERRAAVSTVVRAVRSARPGERVQVATRGLDLPSVARVLSRAHARGVRVRLLTGTPRLTRQERALDAQLDGRSTLDRCRRPCRRTWEAENPPSMVLVSDAAGRPRQLVEVSRRLRGSAISSPTRSTVHTSGPGLAEAQQAFASR